MRLEINRHFQPLIDNKSEILILCGGAGSGKSFFAAQKLVARGFSEGGHRFLVLRKIRSTIRQSCIDLVCSVLTAAGVPFEENKTDRVVTFAAHTGERNEILFNGLDDPEKIKSIQGITGVWIEEATEFSEQDFNQIDLRLRGQLTNYKQIVLTFNPVESAAPWIKRRFFDAKDQRAHVDRSTAWDNGKIDREYLAKLDGITDETYRKIYRFGEWAVARGIIYRNWDIVAASAWPASFHDVVYGVDFGYNHKAAVVKIGFANDDEYMQQMLYASELITSEIIARLKSMSIPNYTPIYCDAAEPDRIQEIYRAGFNAKPAVKDIEAGIDCCMSKRLHVHENSQDMANELRKYKWAEDKNGNTLDKVPVKFDDDLCDAMRYGIFTHLHHIPSTVGALKWR